MSKGITDADKYVFKLSDDLKEMAENELRETAATRDFALKALREWIESNPRIVAARLGKYDCLEFYSIVIKLVKQGHTNTHIRSIIACNYDFFGARIIRFKINSVNT